MKNQPFVFFINLGLLLAGIVMVFSGLTIQVKYHMDHGESTEASLTAFRLDYYSWSDIHKVSIICVTSLMIIHFIFHWKWYKTVIRKKLFGKNQQVIVLSVLFILVAVTGYIPWLIHMTGGENMIRELFIEIHDKIALILFVYLILHVTKRLKWYTRAYSKLRKNRSV